MKRMFMVASAILLMLPNLAQAQRLGSYWGVSLGDYAAELPTTGREDDETDVGLRLGYHFSDMLAVEARAGTDVKNIAGDNDGTDPETEYLGVFARFDLPYERTNVYFLLGASHVQFDGDSVSDDNDPIAAGVGIELYGSETTALSLEYMNYSDGAYSGIGLGFVHHFDWPSFR